MTGERRVTAARLVRNTLANAIGSVIVAVLALILTPFLLHRLGPAEYGVWLLALGLTFANGYLGVADLGLQQAGVRLVAEAHARDDVDAMNRIVATLLLCFVVLGVVLGGALALLAAAVADVFNIEPRLHSIARQVFVLVGVQIALDLPAAAFMALVEGTQRYGVLRLLDVGPRVVWAAAVVVAVSAGRGAVSMAVISLAVAAVVAVVAYLLARRIEPRLRVSPRLANRAMYRTVLSNGVSFLALRLSSIVYRQMDRFIIGIVLTSASVARYEVAYKIHATAAIALAVAPSAVMPAAAYLGVASDTSQLRTLYLRGTKYAIALCLPVSVAAVLYARALIVTWVGDEYAGLTDTTRLFLAYPMFVAVHTVGVTMLVGIGRMRPVMLLGALAVALNLVLSAALAPHFGINGVVWGTLVGYAVVWIPYTKVMLETFGVTARTWLRETIYPNVPGTAAQVLLGLATVGVVEDFDQLWQVGTATLVSIAASLAVFAFVVVGRDERVGLLRAVTRRDRSVAVDPSGPFGTP